MQFIKYLIFIFISFLTFVSFSQAPKVIGQQFEVDYLSPKLYEIGPIRIEGADNFDPQAIKLIMGLRQGEKVMIPGDKFSKAIKNLWKEEIFSDAEIQIEKEINGVVYLVVKLTPRPKLSRYKFVGVNKRDADKLREEISLYTGKTITESLVFNTENKIKGYFREKGYYDVNVHIDREKDTIINNSEIFFIKINKHKKTKIKHIIIEGNTSIPTWKLRMAMKDTKQKQFWRFFKRSKFTTVAFERDKEAIIAKYNAIGLRDASITLDSVYRVDQKHIAIQLRIAEGEKYYFGNIEWLGNTKFRSSYLDTVLGIKKGDIYDKTLLEKRLRMSEDGRDISSLYMDRGYLFFQINPVETNVTDNQINYQMRIIEGKEARVRKIIIKGNTKTNENVIRREIRTKPGDLFSRNDIMRTQRELAQLGFFNEQGFQVNPMPNPADGTVDIEYTVEEKSSDQIELSGGYGGRGLNGYSSSMNGMGSYGSGLIGTLGLTFNNFSTRNFFKKDAWTPLPGGDGQRLSVRGQTSGKMYQSYSFSFTEPWLGGKKPNSLTFSFNHFNYSYLGYLRSNPNFSGYRITGMALGLGRRKKIPDDYFSAYYELSYQYYDLLQTSLFPNISSGFANDVSLKYVLSRSSVSSPIYPQSGSSFTFTAKSTVPYSLFTQKDFTNATEQDKVKFLEYYKLKLSGEWYTPITNDKKLVLRTKFGFAFLGGYSKTKGLTPFERYAMGGSGLSGMGMGSMGREIISLRGYDDLSLSTQGGDPIIAKYTMELRYPISLNPQATFYVLAFAEAGNTFPTFKAFNPLNVKRSAGIGLRVFLPMFGMLGIDYGWGFDHIDYWGAGYNGTSSNAIYQRGVYGHPTFTIGMNLGEL